MGSLAAAGPAPHIGTLTPSATLPLPLGENSFCIRDTATARFPPLPVLRAGAALGFSRNLRGGIKASLSRLLAKGLSLKASRAA
jgi:hypothetical protein